MVLSSLMVSGAGLTVILQAAVLPLDVLTVIVAVPTAFPVTLPAEFTEATEALLEVHVNVSAVFAGKTEAINVASSPIPRFMFAALSEIEDAAALTVTLHAAVLPFSVLTIITVVPALLAVTFPSATVATELSLEVHVKVVSASAGVTVALNVYV